jgi:putative AlgH/UPF0301 family transcriptional regulator
MSELTKEEINSAMLLIINSLEDAAKLIVHQTKCVDEQLEKIEKLVDGAVEQQSKITTLEQQLESEKSAHEMTRKNFIEYVEDIEREALGLKEKAELYKNEASRIEQQLEQEREANRWIPVSERLPKDNETVLFANMDDEFFTGYIFKDFWYSVSHRYCDMRFNITHWKPINPPSEKV